MSAANIGIKISLDGAQQTEADIRRVTQGMNNMGMSAAQLSNNMRMVPAQFTDIVVGLSSGQAPMMVLLQQGGQLKDMFGGVSNAARGLSTYVMGLVNPFTVAAAAGGALVVAYSQGASEAAEFRKEIILSGNAAGVTADQLMRMSSGIATKVGTQGKAAEVLAALVGTGRVARDQLAGAGEAIVAMSSVTGAAVKDMVQDYASLGKEPVQALLRLNEKYNFLTASVYEHVSALQEQGRSEEAAVLAQSTYSAMVIDRASAVKENLGLLEKAWGGVAGAAKAAWDGMLNVGRESTIDEQIRALEKQRDNPMNGINTYGRRDQRTVNKLNAEIDALLQQQRSASVEAANKAEQARVQAEGTEATRAIEQQRKALATSGQKMEADLDKYRRNIAAIKAANPSSELLDKDKISADEAAIRAKYKDKGADSAASKAAREATRELEAYRNLVNDLSGEQDGFSANFNEQVKILYNGWKRSGDSIEVYNRAFEQLLAKQPFAVKAAKEQAEAEKKLADERAKRFKEIEREYEQEVRAANQSASAVIDRVTALKDEEAAIVVARAQNISLFEAIEQVRNARLKEAQAVALVAGNQEMVDALQREISARRELGELNKSKFKRDEASDAFKDFMKADFSSDLAAGFDDASKSLGTFVQTFEKLIDAQDKYNLARGDTSKSAEQLQELDQKYARSQIGMYAGMAGAAKGFFSEKTAGYKALMAAETTLRAIEAASSIQRIAAKMMEGTAVAAVGVANQASGDPYSAFPRMAAMAAIMASIGFAVSGFSGGSSGGFAPTNTGTGTVLGDPEAQSQSITRAIDALKEVDTLTMRYSAGMLGSLKNIEANIGGLATLLVRSGAIEASASGIQTGFKRDALGSMISANFGSAASMVDWIPIVGGVMGGLLKGIGNLIGGLFGSSTKITGQGIFGGAQSLDAILEGGFQGKYYTDVQTKKKTLGITTSTKNKTTYTDADAEFEQQIGTIFSSFYSAIEAAANPLGQSLDVVQQRLDGFVVNIGKVATKGLTGEELQEKLSAVFSAQGDLIAKAALGGFEQFQNIGEGYFETIVRVASGTEEARTTLRRLGMTIGSLADVTNKQGDVSAELVRESVLALEGLTGIAEIMKSLDGTGTELGSTYRALTDVRTTLKLLGLEGEAVGYGLIDGAGGLQELQDAVSAFESAFVDSNTQISMQAERMSIQFGRLGMVLPNSAESFVSLIKSIDTSTDAGQLLLGSVLSLSDGFGDLLDAIKDVGSGIADEIARIRGLATTGTQATMAELQASFAIKTAQARAGDQAAIDALPDISQALLKASEAMAGSSLDVAIARATTLKSLEATLALISDPTKRLGQIPGFASGTDFFPGGLRIVGERGPELELTGASRIFNADQTARILSNVNGGGDYAQMVAELKHLREMVSELRGLREDQRAGFATVARGTTKAATILERLTPDGNSLAVTSVAGG